MTGERLAHRLYRARLRLQAERGPAVDVRDEIAAALSVSRKTYARWESGEREPDIGTIQRLATVLGTTAQWLAFGVKDGQGPAPEVPPGGNPVPVGPAPTPGKSTAPIAGGAIAVTGPAEVAAARPRRRA